MQQFITPYLSYGLFFVLFFFFLLVFFKLLPTLSKHALTHPQPSIEPYFHTVQINSLCKIQLNISALFTPLLLLIGYMTKRPPADAFTLTNYHHFILLFCSAILFLCLSYVLLTAQTQLSPFHRHFKSFIHAPEPHNPILGAFYRSLPPNVCATLKPLEKNEFLSDFFKLFEQEHQPFPKIVFPPTFISPVLTEIIAYLLIGYNLTLLYLCFFLLQGSV